MATAAAGADDGRAAAWLQNCGPGEARARMLRLRAWSRRVLAASDNAAPGWRAAALAEFAAMTELRSSSRKPRMTFDQLAARRRNCRDLKARGLPCPDDAKAAAGAAPAPAATSATAALAAAASEQGTMVGGGPVRWSCGVMTCAQRLDTLLAPTLASIRRAGFDELIVFADGVPPERWAGSRFHHERAVLRPDPPVRTAGAWLLTLAELWVRRPDADLFAVFQDDFEMAAGTRELIERDARTLPAKSYLNLLTFMDNEPALTGLTARGWREGAPEASAANRERMARGERGFQTGRGAVALVLPRAAVIELLSCRELVERFADEARGWKRIDGAVVHVLNKARFRELVHNPSLTLHLGVETTIVSPDKNPRWREGKDGSKTFVESVS